MSAPDLGGFDTLQTTNAWLKEIAERSGPTDSAATRPSALCWSPCVTG